MLYSRTREGLDRLLADQGSSPFCMSGYGYFHGKRMHPNPRFFKYYWSIYTYSEEQNPNDHRLPYSEGLKRLADLSERKIPHIYSNYRVLRNDSGIPFDLEHEKYKDYEFAPSFDKDSDPEQDGFR